MQAIRNARRFAILGMLLAALTGCGGAKRPAAAAATAPGTVAPAASAPQGPAANAIRTFHARLDAADFAAIWADADETFRRSVSRTDYERFMTNARSRLGHVVSTATVRSTPMQSADRATLQLAQNTTFERGAGLETFTFLMKPRGAVLIGYNLQSAALTGS